MCRDESSKASMNRRHTMDVYIIVISTKGRRHLNVK